MYTPLSPSLPEATQSQSNERRFHFSLRTLFGSVFVVACFFGWWHISNLPTEAEKLAILQTRITREATDARMRVRDVLHQAIREVPASFRDWEGGLVEADPQAREMNGLDAIHEFRYTNGDIEAKLGIYLGTHKTVPLFRISPFSSLHIETVHRIDVPSTTDLPHCFWLEQFYDKALGPASTAYYVRAYTVRGQWEAPTNPRPHFAADPWAVVVALILRGGQLDPQSAQREATNLLQQFLPELEQRLFAKLPDTSAFNQVQNQLNPEP